MSDTAKRSQSNKPATKKPKATSGSVKTSASHKPSSNPSSAASTSPAPAAPRTVKRRNKASSTAVIHSFAPGQPRPPHYTSMSDLNLITRHFVLSAVQQCSKKEDVSFLAAIDAAVHTARSTAQLRQWLSSIKAEEKGGMDDRTILELITCTRKDGVLRSDEPRPAELEHVRLDSACTYHYATFTVHAPSTTVGGGSGSVGSFTMAFATSMQFVEEEEELFAISVSLPATTARSSTTALSTAVSSYEHHLLADAAPARKQQHRLIHDALTQLRLPAALFFALLHRAALTLPAEAKQRVERHIQLTAAMYKHLHEGGERPDDEVEEDGSEGEDEDDEDDEADLDDFVVADDVVEMDTDADEDHEEDDKRKKQRGHKNAKKGDNVDKPKKAAAQEAGKRPGDKERKEEKAGGEAESKTNGGVEAGKDSKQQKGKPSKQNGTTKAEQQAPQQKKTPQQDKQPEQERSKAEQLVHHTGVTAEEQQPKQPSPRKEKRRRDDQPQLERTDSSSSSSNKATTESSSAQSTSADGEQAKRPKKAKKEAGQSNAKAQADSTRGGSSSDKAEVGSEETNKAGDQRGMKQRGKVNNPQGLNGQTTTENERADKDKQSEKKDSKEKAKQTTASTNEPQRPNQQPSSSSQDDSKQEAAQRGEQGSAKKGKKVSREQEDEKQQQGTGSKKKKAEK